MFKNPNYVRGPADLLVPSSLQLGDFLLAQLWGAKEKTALINAATEESITNGQIAQQGMNFAISLAHLGLRKGEVVALCTENRLEFWGVVIGTACSGAVLTTMNQGYVEAELRHVMQISKPKFLVCSPTVYKQHAKLFHTFQHIHKIIVFGNDRQEGALLYNDLTIPLSNNSGEVIVNNRLNRNIRYDEFESVDVQGQQDTLLILYSSGTTGLPKGVMLTHLNVILICKYSSVTDVNVPSLIIAPWFHTMGLLGTLYSLAVGRKTVFIPRFEVDLFLRSVEKYKIAVLTVVPPVLVAVCKSEAKYDLSSVVVTYSGAAPLHKETADLVKRKFPNVQGVLQGYGMTETTLSVTKDVLDDKGVKPGSVGVVNPGLTVKIVDIESRTPLGPNQPGEICVKGPIVMKGYVGRDNSEVFDSEGFFATGDVGYYDEDRRFFIVDRLKELIKYKGYQVAPAELEDLLLKHEGVRDAGVVGIPDAVAGEVPLAFVVRQPNLNVTEEEIKKFVAGKLSNPKQLRGGVRFVDAIPKNPSGKILRKDLRKLVPGPKSKL